MAKNFCFKKISVRVTIFCVQSLTDVHGVQKIHDIFLSMGTGGEIDENLLARVSGCLVVSLRACGIQYRNNNGQLLGSHHMYKHLYYF